MPDADVRFWSGIELESATTTALAVLIEQTPWRQDRIQLFGKVYDQPRLTAWYGDPTAAYTYSGLTLEPLPWTTLLASLRAQVEALTDATFNSVLLNYYRDNRDAMGMHADDEPELGQRPVIASLSLGATRTLVFRHKTRRDLAPVKIPLPTGSLLLMQGSTQSHWKHGINRSTRACGPRINLTFRRVISPRQSLEKSS
jgi:alkylated DNA repair dioxygenase AlkB